MNKYTARTPAGLRETLFETMDQFLEGKIPRRNAQVVCEIAKQIVETGRLELQTIQAAKLGLELAESMERRQEQLTDGLVGDET